jgi:large subunit ribosomal protein L23
MTTIYDVLRRPLLTEKSNYQGTKLHQYAFEVRPEATKGLVKDAVETLFDVKVLRVNVINVPAKMRRSRNRRMTVREQNYKKAIVTLAADDHIPFFEGVE